MNHRESILKRIQSAIANRLFPDYRTEWEVNEIFFPVDDLVSTFQKEVENVGGVCVLCKDETDMFVALQSLMIEKGLDDIHCIDPKIIPLLLQAGLTLGDPSHEALMPIGITACELLVARTGSVVVSSQTSLGRKMHVQPNIHVVMAYENQLVPHLHDGFMQLQQKYTQHFPSALTVITGPSRTADIEKTLVMGAHGPKELIIFVLQCSNATNGHE